MLVRKTLRPAPGDTRQQRHGAAGPGIPAAARAAFTLMELLVVVAILLVLVGVATPLYMSYLESSKLRVAKADAVRLAQELKNFYVLHNAFPEPVGSWDLLPLDKKPPLDPWGRPYEWSLVEVPQLETNITVPVVWSAGPNGVSGDADDIRSDQ
ncbi:MAG: hypothetical protein C4296_06660 [Gemmataceae bacterium]